MLNLSKHTKIKFKPKPAFKFKNCSRVYIYCTYISAQRSYTTQHRAVLVVYHPNFQTIIIAQMLSIRVEGHCLGKLGPRLSKRR